MILFVWSRLLIFEKNEDIQNTKKTPNKSILNFCVCLDIWHSVNANPNFSVYLQWESKGANEFRRWIPSELRNKKTYDALDKNVVGKANFFLKQKKVLTFRDHAVQHVV